MAVKADMVVVATEHLQLLAVQRKVVELILAVVVAEQQVQATDLIQVLGLLLLQAPADLVL